MDADGGTAPLHRHPDAVLTLAVLCQWQTSGSERQFLAWATRQWRSYFPRLVSQSAFNRRARQLYGVLAGLSEWIRQAVEPHLGGARVYEVIDGVPVPLMRRCRGRRQRCFGLEADFGHGGSDQELVAPAADALPPTADDLASVLGPSHRAQAC